MAKYQNSQNSEGVCEKLRNASFSPFFRKIRNLVQPQNAPTNTSPKYPLPTNKPTSIVIPIESSHQLLTTRLSKKEKISKPHTPKNEQMIEISIGTTKNEPKSRGSLQGQQLIKPKIDMGSQMTGNGKPIHYDEGGGYKNWGHEDVNGRSSVYIDRIKNKLRTAEADEKNLGRPNSFNDKVSNYINNAKLKLRTTSGFGGGK